MDELLPDFLYYESITGIIRWKVKYGKMAVNSQAGYIASDGYIRIGFKGKKYLAHRVAWFLYYGSWPSKVIDHIDGNKANNRIENLRDVTKSLNGFNRVEQHGVGLYRNGRWRAYLNYAGKQTHIGYFDSEQEALLAHKEFKDKFLKDTI